MSARHFCSALLITAAVVAAVSCKKDEDQETKPSLNGSLRFSGLPEYILAEETGLKVTPRGIYHPENKPVGYYWKQNPSTDNTPVKNDTVSTADGSTVLKFKDSLYTCTVTCGAFADGYYDSSVSTETTVVRPGINGSVTNAGFTNGNGNLDQSKYPHSEEITDEYTEIGGYRWMRRNLSSVSAKDKTAGIPYMNCDAMDDVFGRYYTYSEALLACPDGWELPSEEAWVALAKSVKGQDAVIDGYSNIEDIAGALMVNALFNADVTKSDEENSENTDYLMWSYWSKVKMTNSTGLSILPVGYADNPRQFKASFKDSDKAYAMFITADEADKDNVYCRYIIENDNTLHIGHYDKNSFSASVRCVQKIK